MANLERLQQHLRGLLGTARRSTVRTALALSLARNETPVDDRIQCDLDSFSVYQGRLTVRGRIHSSGPRVVGVGVLPPDRSWGWIEPGLNRPTETSNQIGSWTFSFAVPCPDGTTALSWKLRVALSDGSWADISDARPQALRGNEFAKTWELFREQLGRSEPGTMVDVGSRTPAGASYPYRDMVPGGWKYVGFDIGAGPNVDVVGDVHRLSSYFAPGSVHAIMSMATFEHLAMPWKVALEFNRVLRSGGLVCAVTHQSWPVHEAPWDYWRFSEYSWAALFNEATGFQIEQAAMGELADIVPQVINEVTAEVPRYPGYLGSIVLARKIADTSLSWDVSTETCVVGNYPLAEPNNLVQRGEY